MGATDSDSSGAAKVAMVMVVDLKAVAPTVVVKIVVAIEEVEAVLPEEMAVTAGMDYRSIAPGGSDGGTGGDQGG